MPSYRGTSRRGITFRIDLLDQSSNRFPIDELIDLGKEYIFYFALRNDLVCKAKLGAGRLLHRVKIRKKEIDKKEIEIVLQRSRIIFYKEL